MNKTLLWCLMSILTALSVFDFILTKNYIKQVGLYGELNLLMRFSADRFGIISILIIKLFVLSLMALCIMFSQQKLYKRIAVSLSALIAIMIYIVVRGIVCNLSM